MPTTDSYTAEAVYGSADYMLEQVRHYIARYEATDADETLGFAIKAGRLQAHTVMLITYVKTLDALLSDGAVAPRAWGWESGQ